MKGLILFLLMGLGSLSALAQGSVNFANSSARVCLYNVGFVPAGSAFQAELMYAPDGTPEFAFDTVATRVGAPATFFAPGFFAGGGRTVSTITPAGGFGLFQVRVWESAYGSDYWSAGMNFGRVGKSEVLRVDTGDPTTVPPGAPASLVAAGLTSFTVGAPLGGNQICVPEPRIPFFVIAALGGLILLLRRGANRVGTLMLLFACAGLGTATARAQGSVSFANSSVTRVFTDSPTGTGTTWVPVGSQFTAELMFAPDGTPTAAFQFVAIRVGGTTTFGPVPGLFNGGGRTAQAVTPAGGFGLFQVRVWETAGGNSYNDVLARFDSQYRVGQSVIMRVDTGDPTTIPPGTPTPLTSAGLTSFCVGCIPEPSIVLLTVCGLTALVFGKRTFKTFKNIKQ